MAEALYVGPHVCQLDDQWSAITHSSGCTWTATTNGVRTVTHGEMRPGPDRIHNLVRRNEETSPTTPGWSIPDADLAMKRFGLGFRNLTGGRWDGVLHELGEGHYVVLQGDSEEFSNLKCSGKFDGDHCIGVNPKRKEEGGEVYRWIDDGICKTGRWEKQSVLRRYAENLDPLIRYGVFTEKVPGVNDPILRFGAKALPKPTPKTIHEPSGVEAIVRRRPTTDSANLNQKPGGSTFVAYQVTNSGQSLAGSRRWFGNRLGRRWMHESAF